MNEGEPIIIRRVSNGYIVQPRYRDGEVINANETMVFESLESLQEHIRHWFSVFENRDMLK